MRPEPVHTLILGGAKSGKSRLALELAADHPGRRVFVATAQAGDGEMARRISRHQAERGPGWELVEEPLALARALAAADAPGALLLVDCLTLWVSNLLTGQGLEDEEIVRRGEELGRVLAGLAGRAVLVANEVGLGIVPADPLARRFRDLAGGLNQSLARACGRVVLVAAGLPLALKGPPI
jgi:adenosylcobinamide kinase/adenosylcobinamide-phosphate guanylyltransferase